MGSYDSVTVACPGCAAAIEVQSKSGECRFERYTAENAPLEVLSGLHRTAVTCDFCGAVWTISIMPRATLTPGSAAIRDESPVDTSVSDRLESRQELVAGETVYKLLSPPGAGD